MAVAQFEEITNSHQLRILLKQIYPKYDNHVVAIDELQAIQPQMKQIIIVNYKPKDQEGTHWVSIQARETKYVVFFDSYGLAPPEKILTFLRRYKELGLAKDMVMSITKIQPKTGKGSKACGYFIMKLLELYIHKNKEVYEAINSITVANTLAYAKKLKRKYYYFLLRADQDFRRNKADGKLSY